MYGIVGAHGRAYDFDRQEIAMTRARTRSAIAVAAIGLLAAACGRDKAQSGSSELQNDLQLASTQAAPAPTFQDTALMPTPQPAASEQRAPAPKRSSGTTTRTQSPRRIAQREEPAPRRTPEPTPEPAPAPAPKATAAAAQIGAGSGIGMTIGSRVCTSTARPGDKVVATTTSSVTGTHGAVIPAGSAVVLEVASVSNDPASITFRLRAIDVNDHTYTASGDVTSDATMERSKVAGSGSSDKKKVIGGAIAGAVLGQIFGHSTKSTVIGAAAGGAAGAIAAKAGEKYESCLPAGSSMRGVLDGTIAM